MSKLKPPSKIGKPTGLPHPKPSGGIPAPSSSRGQSKCRFQKKKKKQKRKKKKKKFTLNDMCLFRILELVNKWT